MSQYALSWTTQKSLQGSETFNAYQWHFFRPRTSLMTREIRILSVLPLSHIQPSCDSSLEGD